jgi:hypothetical protein
MKLITPIVALCALLGPGALADTFEGTLTMTVSSPNSKNGPQSLNLSLKDGNMRTDIETSRGTMSAIMDMKNQQMIILMPQQRMYMIQPMNQPSAAQGQYQQYQGQAQAAGNTPTLVQTGEKETILGYECTKYTATNDKGTAEIWVTDQLGTFIGLFHGGAPGRPSQPPPDWENALKGKAFFPMRVVGTNDKGTFKMEVTAINKTSLPDSLFAPPEGWQKFDLGSIMGGAFGGFRGGPPPGGSN